MQIMNNRAPECIFLESMVKATSMTLSIDAQGSQPSINRDIAWCQCLLVHFAFTCTLTAMFSGLKNGRKALLDQAKGLPSLLLLPTVNPWEAHKQERKAGFSLAIVPL